MNFQVSKAHTHVKTIIYKNGIGSFYLILKINRDLKENYYKKREKDGKQQKGTCDEDMGATVLAIVDEEVSVWAVGCGVFTRVGVSCSLGHFFCFQDSIFSVLFFDGGVAASKGRTRRIRREFSVILRFY